jgi:DNA invertase Pin-like site-specific DNA recombinase
MKVFYSRVSTENQNSERQEQNLEGFNYLLTDKCSGLIPLWERPKGKQLHKLITDGKVTHLEIHSIDRLGRSTLDVLNVWNQLTEMKVTVVCRNPNIRNYTTTGELDYFSELLVSILSTLSSFEKSLIRERQMEGIRIRQAKGLYTGRAINTKESDEKFLAKPKIKKIIQYLNDGYTQNEIVKILKCSFSTIGKVKSKM